MGGEATTLGEVASIQTGPFGSQLHASDYKPFGVPVVMPTNIVERRIDPSSIMRISQEDADRLFRHKLRPGDLIFSRRGEIDKCALTEQENVGWICGTGCLLARIDPRRASPAYVAFHINELNTREWLKSNAVGLVMPNLNTGILERLPLRLPALPEQEAIAELLETLDDKIELNRRMAETLEGVARALFKSWFVNFDPVRAKAEGRPTGLPDDLAALFPSQFSDHGLPEGWSKSPLGELVAQSRDTIDPATLGNTAVAHFSLPAFDAGRRPSLEAASEIKSLKLAVSPPAVLFSKLNPETSRVWPVLAGAGLPMLASTEFLSFRPTSTSIPFSFIEGLLSSTQFRDTASGLVTGTSKSHQRVQPAALLSTEWVAPPARVSAGFDHFAGVSLERRDRLLSEGDTLAALRDTLLPMLISGELRVRDAERAVAAA